MKDHPHDALLGAGHPVVHVPLAMLPPRLPLPETDRAYVAAMVATLRSGGALPPIVGVYADGRVTQCDGNHRYAAYAAAGADTVPMILFASSDDFGRAVDIARETPAERTLRQRRVSDARQQLANIAAGRSVRVSAPERAELERAVQPEPRAIGEIMQDDTKKQIEEQIEEPQPEPEDDGLVLS
jgi:hypothetical protein